MRQAYLRVAFTEKVASPALRRGVLRDAAWKSNALSYRPFR
jgi:hypothetical protein